jgi:hypothetical protein
MRTAFLGAHVDAADADDLRQLARAAERSAAAEIRLALRQWVADAPRREQAERISRMSLDELDTYLAGVDDGREDERPARGERGAVKPRAQVAGHET